MDERKKVEIAAAYRRIILALDIPLTEGNKDTPERAAKALLSLTEGYNTDIKAILTRTFEEEHDEIVLVKNIEIISLCEHHLLPFFGSAHIAYIPNGKVLGLSKIVRLARMYSQRLQLQERLTSQIADTLMTELKPKGVGVIIEAKHMCMMIRGVKDANAETVTSVMRGCFLKAEEGKSPKEEMMRLIYG
jgi:GTP cyclohydrolase I